MSYPPAESSSSRQLSAAEEYELPHLPPSENEAGPSRRRQSGNKPGQGQGRTLTLHPGQSTANLLFSASGSSGPTAHSPRKRHTRIHSTDLDDNPVTSKRYNRAHFLNEDHERNREHDDGDGEQVQLPDFGHMLGFIDEGEDHFAIAQSMRTRWKRKLYLLLEEPSSGREAFFVHVLVTGVILFSAVLTVFSTMPSFHTDPLSTRILFGMDTTIVVLFTMEYFARSLAHSDSWHQYYTWATSFFALLDLIAILPYYIEVAQNEDTTILFRFSILRTFRLLRVFRAFKYQNQMLLTIEVMYVAVQRSKDALYALSFFILLVLVLFSTLIYFAERGSWDANLGGFVDSDGDPSLFDSIPKTAWFSLVTMSTVGYGEVVPKSFLGKLLTVPLLMFGLLLIALPSFVLGRNFAIVFDAMTTQVPKPVSAMTSPRESFEDTIPPTTLPSTEPSSHAPLLPVTTASTSSTPIPLSKSSRSTTPLPPNSSGMASSASAAQRGVGLPRMWDGGMEGLGSAPVDGGKQAREKDLTNVKLAKNQLVLLEQIDSLRRTIDKQGEMLALLASALHIEDTRPNGTSNVQLPNPTSRISGEEQFALGDSDDEGGH